MKEISATPVDEFLFLKDWETIPQGARRERWRLPCPYRQLLQTQPFYGASSVDIKGRDRIIHNLILLVIATVTTAFWILSFSGVGATSNDAKYLASEYSFPAADGRMVVAQILAIAGLLRRKPWEVLFALISGSASIFLGLMDVLYNLHIPHSKRRSRCRNDSQPLDIDSIFAHHDLEYVDQKTSPTLERQLLGSVDPRVESRGSFYQYPKAGVGIHCMGYCGYMRGAIIG